MIDKKQPIIIKKVFHGGHGHHGGAWKVAFADFVTAMMAFFMLMWLMGSTTKEERAAISEYFNNPSMTPGTSVSPAPGSVQGPGGASSSLIKLGGGAELYKEKEKEKEKEKIKEVPSKEEQQEKALLDNLMESLKEAMEKSQALKPFKDQLLLDITPEGLRIQIVDKENRPMFDSGSARLKHYTYDILRELARYISTVPNHISISGHTDATPYPGENYGNWELSTDRANAARRVLTDNGVAEGQIGRVVGLASSVLFDKEHPQSPINRRIAIIVMNKKTEEGIVKSEGGPEAATQEQLNEVPNNIPLPERDQSSPLPPLQPAQGTGETAPEPQAAPLPKQETQPPAKPESKPAPSMNLPMEYL